MTFTVANILMGTSGALCEAGRRSLRRAAVLASALLALTFATPAAATNWTFNWALAQANWPLAGWTNNAWPGCGTTGTVSNSRTYANVNASAIDVRVTITVTAGCFQTTPNYPAYSYAANGGTTGSPADLDLNLDFTNLTTSRVTLLFEFFATGTTTPAPVAMTGIAMRDIDRQNNQWQDVLTMTAVNASGTTINPDFISQYTATPNWTPTNPPAGTTTITATGTNGIPATNQASWASFVFASQKIRSMTLLYTPGDGGGNSNPSQQRIYLSGFAFSDVAITTQAIVSDVRAYVEHGQPWVEWETASEVGTAGFNVYRLDSVGNHYVRLNDGLLPALIGSPRGGVYRFPDSDVLPGGTYTYQLEEVEARGTKRIYGPFTVTASLGMQPSAGAGTQAHATESATGRPDRYTRQSRAPDGRKVEPLAVRHVTTQAKAAAARRSSAANTAVRILVEQDGLYAVTADEIAGALGSNLQQVRTWIRNSQLRLQQRGQPIAWMADPGNERIYFYGQALAGKDSVHTRYNVYWLDQAAGLEMKVVKGRGPAPVAAAQWYPSLVRAEENKVPAPFLATDPEADFWYWNYVLAEDPDSGARSFLVPAPGAVRMGSATLNARLQGATDLAPGNDHRAHLWVNGTVVGEVAWDGIAPKVLSVTFDAALLAADGNNDITVEGTLDPGIGYSVFWVDGFSLEYQRAYLASSDELRLTGAGNRVVTVGGFSGSYILVLDISDPRKPQWLANTTVTPSGAGYAVSFAPAKPNAVYLAAMAKAPVAVEGAMPSTVRNPDNAARYLVLAPRALRAGADVLAAYRGGKVVELEDIYDGFSFGIADPNAIRDFLAYAYRNWLPRPRYGALLGKGTIDPKNYTGLGTNLFPVLMASTPHGLFASDNRYADLDDDGVPELVLGRIPALTSEDVIRYVAKLTAYESNHNQVNQALLVADIPDAGGDFTANSFAVAQALQANGIAITPVNLEEVPVAQARQMIIDTLNSPTGVRLFNFVGHGGVDVLANAAVFTNADVSQLVNGTRLPVFLAFTCAAGDGSYPGYDSLAETLLWREGGGAIGAVAPTGLSDNGQAHILNMSLVRALVGPRARVTLGDASAAALTDFARKGAERYMLDKYSVTGDPAVRVQQ